ISHKGLGKIYEIEKLFAQIQLMVETSHVHNVNLVTVDHYLPHVILLSEKIKERFDIPIVANISGYQSLDSLKLMEDFIDIYLPDFKYADPDLSRILSRAYNYPGIALDAIYEMVKQKGMLKIREEGPHPTAIKGVLIRHLIIPGHVQNSIEALDMLFCEFGRSLPISLMSQYCPVIPQRDQSLNRTVTEEEFSTVLGHALELGFLNLFFQYPEEGLTKLYLPDFESQDPFQITRSDVQEKTFRDL
ncbi:MAG: radical SAM protein, partial [Desulfatiglandales bacterium]